MLIVQFSTDHSLQSLAMNIRLDDEIDAIERVIVISFWIELTQFWNDDNDD